LSIILKAGENATSDVLKWMEDDEGDPGYQTLTE
jgi:hypothetical protein